LLHAGAARVVGDGREAVAQLGELARRADLGARAAEVAQRFAAGAERIHQQLSPWYGR